MHTDIIPHDPLVRHHAWCHDVARDAAVRAAEDSRDRPLPTLGECIAKVCATRPKPCGECPGCQQIDDGNRGYCPLTPNEVCLCCDWWRLPAKEKNK